MNVFLCHIYTCIIISCIEKDIVDVSVIKDQKGINAIGFQYKINNEKYNYYYSDVTEGNNNEQN